MKKISLVLTIVMAALFMFSGCKKTNNEDDFSATKDDAFAEATFDDVTSIADEAYTLSTSGNFKSADGRIFLSDCATVTLDTTVFPRVLTIDFGDTNCLGNDGRYRRGKILISFTGRYWQPGTIITTTFDEYYVNDNQVEGTKVVTNNGYNDSGNMNWDMSVNGIITLADGGGTISWNSQRNREWIEGISTPYNRWDNVYLITGQATGQHANGLHWTRQITSPLRIELACRFIVSGTVEITPEGKPVRILDFGDGTCDNEATVTVNGNTYTIHLRP
jgi:hypothetical protein